MRKTESTIRLEACGEALRLLDETLARLGCPQEQTERYRARMASALCVWQRTLAPDAPLTICLSETRRDHVLLLSVPGQRSSPFCRTEKQDRADGTAAQTGSELRFRYRRGLNQLRLRLPKGNAEEVLFRRELVTLMLPLSLQMLFETVASNVDAVMLGFLDADAMSAVSLVARFTHIHLLVISGLCVALTAMLSQFWGIRDRKRISQIASIGMKISVLLSVLFFVPSILFQRRIMTFYTDIPALLDEGVRYLRIVVFGFLVAPLYRIPYCVMRVTGQMRKSVRFAMIGCGANLALNAIFIFGLRLGIRSAAYATLGSALLQAGMVFADGCRADAEKIPWFFGSLVKDPMTSVFLKRAWPTVSQYLIWILGNNILASAFGHMNADIMAADSILNIISSIFVSIARGLSQGAGILMGGMLGRGELERAKKRARTLVHTGTRFGLINTALFLAAALALQVLPMRFSAQTLACIRAQAAVYAVNTFFIIYNAVVEDGMLYVGGDGGYVLFADAIVIWGVLVPVALLGTHWLPIPAAVMILILRSDQTLSFPFRIVRWHSGKWARSLTGKGKGN